MNKFLYFLAFLCFCFGCTENKQKLFVYTWSDYFDPELIAKFESDNNCEVVIDTFDSNETALAKLLAGANSYDIITPTSYIIPTMVDNKIIKPLDHTKLQNVKKNFDKKYSNLLLDKEFKYSIPYAFSITGLMYQKNVVPKNFDMFNVNYLCITNLFWQNRVCILNDIREIVGISLLENGYSVNSIDQNEINKAIKTAIILKQSARKMDNEMYKNGIASGEIFIGMAYNADAMQVMSETDTIGFTIPEKTTCSFDEFSISINSKNEDLAYKFIDYFYEQEIAAKNVEYIYTAMPIKEIEKLINKDLPNRSLVLPSSEILSRCYLINVIDSNANALYNKAWDEIKATK
jgi:spermidine/putrescine transport system substrate-binding protein